MDSYGAWMIADRRHRRPSKKTVVEENRGNGKGEVIAVNLGKKLKNTTAGSLIISARYDALNASHEDLAEKRAGDSRGIVIKETRTRNIEEKQRDGRPLGHKKQRAIISPIDQRQEKSPQVEEPCGGPKIATGNNVQTEKNWTKKNYKVKDKKGNGSGHGDKEEGYQQLKG
ncbi:hypothetical protein OIU74_004945 [Salix koriyanagi]|uniref:Uncharacterized protein n=1 Tax=Salix koriyanagi TaxID=2511006 RepID=A0A9Q0UNE8_9ROSI|nr:hypothetical protein OIU74_004945 [Salix koriyanagi]